MIVKSIQNFTKSMRSLTSLRFYDTLLLLVMKNTRSNKTQRHFRENKLYDSMTVAKHSECVSILL